MLRRQSTAAIFARNVTRGLVGVPSETLLHEASVAGLNRSLASHLPNVTSKSEATAPLSGARHRLGACIAGPYCWQLLADFGADVIKLEPSAAAIRCAARFYRARWLPMFAAAPVATREFLNAFGDSGGLMTHDGQADDGTA